MTQDRTLSAGTSGRLACTMLAVALSLAACGGSSGDNPPPPPPAAPQITATASADGGFELPHAELRYLLLNFSESLAKATNTHKIRYFGPFGEIGGGLGLENEGRTLSFESLREPIYPNAQYSFSIPPLEFQDGSSKTVAPVPPTRAPIREMVTTGLDHACILRETGRVYCWGRGITGQLGIGNLETIGDQAAELGNALVPADLGTHASGQPLRAVQLGSGHYHNCALLETGAVKCWGLNSNGQLGRGNSDHIIGGLPGDMGNALPAVALGTGRTAIFIATGGDRSCALLDNGQLKCWGDNPAGALGIGTSASSIGTRKEEMGDALPSVNLGTGRQARHVTVGNTHTCATLDTFDIKCWGSNSAGELGLGDTRNRGSVPGDMGDALATVRLGDGVHAQRVEAGIHFTCALLDMRQMKCWGLNAEGQLGIGEAGDRGATPAHMGDALKPASLPAGTAVRFMTVGSAGACAIEHDAPARLFCWGANDRGQLGLDDTLSRGLLPQHMGNNAPRVKLPAGVKVADVALSKSTLGKFGCARLADSRLYCWGDNFGSVVRPADRSPAGDQDGEMAALQPINLGAAH